MKLAVGVFLLAASLPAQAMPIAISRCLDHARTQADTDHCADLYRQGMDAQLQATFDAVVQRFESRPAYVARLREAQRAWLAWRQAEIDASYAPAPARPQDRFSRPVCRGFKSAELTQDRIKQLRRLIEPAPEGDICPASMPVP